MRTKAPSISIVDSASRNTRSVNVGEIPFAISVNSETSRVYALTYSTPSMVAIERHGRDRYQNPARCRRVLFGDRAG